MNNMKKLFSVLAVCLISGPVLAEGFDEPTGWDNLASSDLKLTPYIGIFEGGDIALGVQDAGGEVNKIVVEDGLTMGLRLGKESTYWGCELSAGGVFADEEVSNGIDGTMSGNANWYLVNADILLFPVGNCFADGALRPYIGAGPGLAYYNADTELVDSKALFDLNVATGAIITMSESLPKLRLDYRWHFVDGSGYIDHCYKELTLGLCFDF